MRVKRESFVAPVKSLFGPTLLQRNLGQKIARSYVIRLLPDRFLKLYSGPAQVAFCDQSPAQPIAQPRICAVFLQKLLIIEHCGRDQLRVLRLELKTGAKFNGLGIVWRLRQDLVHQTGGFSSLSLRQ